MVMSVFVFRYGDLPFSITRGKDNTEYMIWPSMSSYAKTVGAFLTEQEVYDLFEELTLDELTRTMIMGYDSDVYKAVYDSIQNLHMNEW
jgi:hypothetical protein